MVRKIKVVDINEIKPIESINPNTIGNVILNDEEDIIEGDIPHVISSSDEEVIPTDALARTSSIDEAPRNLQDLADAIVKITKETNEELKHIKIDKKTEKDIEKIPCPNCFKMMSVKSLKYSHQKNCKTFKTETKIKEEPPTPKHIPERTPEPSISIPIPEPPKPILNKPMRPTRNEIKQQRLNNLISQAF